MHENRANIAFQALWRYRVVDAVLTFAHKRIREAVIIELSRGHGTKEHRT